MGNSTSKTSDPIIRMKQGTSSSSHKSRMCEEDCQLCAITNDTDEIYTKSSATKIPNPKPKVETPIVIIEKPKDDSERLAKEKQLKEEQERLMREKPSRDEMTSGGCAGKYFNFNFYKTYFKEKSLKIIKKRFNFNDSNKCFGQDGQI